MESFNTFRKIKLLALVIGICWVLAGDGSHNTAQATKNCSEPYNRCRNKFDPCGEIVEAYGAELEAKPSLSSTKERWLAWCRGKVLFEFPVGGGAGIVGKVPSFCTRFLTKYRQEAGPNGETPLCNGPIPQE